MRPSDVRTLFPVFLRVVFADPIQIDHTGMWLGAIAHQIGIRQLQIDRKAQPVLNDGRSIDQRRIRHAMRQARHQLSTA